MSFSVLYGTWLLYRHHQLVDPGGTALATITDSAEGRVAYKFSVGDSLFRGSEFGSHYRGRDTEGSQVPVSYSKNDPNFNTLTPEYNFNNGRLLIVIGLSGLVVLSSMFGAEALGRNRRKA